MNLANLKILLFLCICCSNLAYGTSWRTLSPEQTVLMTLPQGEVVIELAPQFSPNHVKQFIELTSNNHYDGNTFYRVIDGFVAQVGPDKNSRKDRIAKKLTLEGEWKTTPSWPFTLVQDNDLFAKQTGFKDGFALGVNKDEGKAWLAHCPGTVAMARSNGANSASSHFYIVNGQAPRYLDRLMTIFGRVVYGMQHVQSIQRTSVIEGDKAIAKKDYTPIIQMQLMSDVAKDKQIQIAVEDTDSAEFIERLVKRRAREHAFFFKKPPQVLDVCQVGIQSKRIN